MDFRIVNGSISYGAETILEEINFTIKEKDKIAIVGRNGSGKTTLLKAIVDNAMLEEGIGDEKFGVYKQGNPVIGYLKQIDFADPSATLLDEILKVYKPLVELEKKIEDLMKRWVQGEITLSSTSIQIAVDKGYERLDNLKQIEEMLHQDYLKSN